MVFKEIEENLWREKAQLCLRCDNALGPNPSDLCEAYKMKLKYCKRKFKCKKFDQTVNIGGLYG